MPDNLAFEPIFGDPLSSWMTLHVYRRLKNNIRDINGLLIPLFLLHDILTHQYSVTALSGHCIAHSPQPSQHSLSADTSPDSSIKQACRGHTSTHCLHCLTGFTQAVLLNIGRSPVSKRDCTRSASLEHAAIHKPQPSQLAYSIISCG